MVHSLEDIDAAIAAYVEGRDRSDHEMAIELHKFRGALADGKKLELAIKPLRHRGL